MLIGGNLYKDGSRIEALNTILINEREKLLMNEELIKMIRELLAKAGVEEEVVAQVEKALTESLAGTTQEEEPEPTPNEPETDEEPTEPTESESVDTSEEAEPTEQEGQVEEVAPAEETPVVEPETPAPFDPAPLLAKVDEQAGIIDEQNKTIEGLTARVDALVQALTAAGIIENSGATATSNTDVVPSPSAPSNDDTDNPMDKVLNQINRRY